MKSIVFFNNKGGVGKTTLACNLVSYINQYTKYKVLIVDGDPQCNTTQVILDDKINEEIYFENRKDYDTLYTCLQPLEDGESKVNLDIHPLVGADNRFKTDIIPGHPKMSIIEDHLSDAWSSVRARETRGYRITNWCYQLTEHFKNDYDLIIFDVGPSLGALNRSIILSCDYMVTPFGSDIFSLLGIKNIAGWIKSWKNHYDSSISEAKQTNKDIFNRYEIIDNTDLKFRFAGYSIQQYVSRKFKTGPRPVKSYDAIMAEIPNTVNDALSFLFNENMKTTDYELGHIPYLYSLIPMAQSAKAPIFELERRDGLVGSQYAQVKSFQNLMSKISEKLLFNIGIT